MSDTDPAATRVVDESLNSEGEESENGEEMRPTPMGEGTENEEASLQEDLAAAPSPSRGLIITIPWSIVVIVIAFVVVAAIAVGIAVPLTRKNLDTTSAAQTASQNVAPTVQPTTFPTLTPSLTILQPTTSGPTQVPTTGAPIVEPTTTAPIPVPATAAPTSLPTEGPLVEPTLLPTALSPGPSALQPIRSPTLAPPVAPPVAQTTAPSTVPTSSLTLSPSEELVIEPTLQPTFLPTFAPSVAPAEDPFLGAEDAPRWNSTGNGLILTVLNALDENYHLPFNLSIVDWNASQAVSISVTPVAPDSRCKPVAGVLKICNGNYGETQWRGINEVLLADGFIVSSVAKLNDFYLNSADDAQIRYTICHQIGHGLGLPHTDENFFNENLGNCMDYTNIPETNQSPDKSIFDFLMAVYGPLERQR